MFHREELPFFLVAVVDRFAADGNQALVIPVHLDRLIVGKAIATNAHDVCHHTINHNLASAVQFRAAHGDDALARFLVFKHRRRKSVAGNVGLLV